MSTRELWKQSPEFRRALRTLLRWSAGGLLIGLVWGLIGRKLPPAWSAVWTLALCGLALAAALYMTWDMRRMERQRLQWEERNRKLIEDIVQLDQQLKRTIEARIPERPPERPGWLQ